MNTRTYSFAWLAAVLVSAAGCTKDSGPLAVNSRSNPTVQLSVGFSAGSSGIIFLAKRTDGGGGGIDSLRVDSALVVLSRVEFLSRTESVTHDSSASGEVETEQESQVTFHGPFLIHVRDTGAIAFASQTIPAGTYDAVQFRIHPLHPGERHEDSDEFEHHGHAISADSMNGASIMVWGAVRTVDGWSSFTFMLDKEFAFRIKGNYTVPEGGGVVNVALQFDITKWFRDVRTGMLLDPTDPEQRDLIIDAIRSSFGSGRGGRDRDHDGHPDR